MKQAEVLTFLGLIVVLALNSCSSADKKRPGDLDWDDLLSNNHYSSVTPVPGGTLTNANASQSKEVPTKKADPTLEQLAAGFQMEKPARYEGGVYGKKGHIPVFAARLADIPDYDRLYWVMVKVLSEKYGCFIKRKASTQSQVHVECRDKRRVVFHRHRGDGWIQFYGRQYNQAGQEVAIRDHKAYVIE